jgi:hypothetical protein
MKKNRKIILGSAALLLVVAVVLGITLFSNKGNVKPEAARVKVESFVNDYLMQGGTATVSDVTEAYGLYKMKINIGSGQIVDSYVSKDGNLFFPQALDIAKTIAEANGTAAPAGEEAAATPTNITKSKKPNVELFIMTHCPYGTQMEKGILPVISALGKKVDFEIKFNDYAMHGEEELDESLAQYCIQKEQGAKYFEYLTCFLKSSDTASCLTSAKIDTAKMNSCVAKTDKQYSVKDDFKNNKNFKGSYPGFGVYAADNTKYNVGGSPTLVINGAEVSSGRDSASLLKTICAAFEEAPKECETVLSSASPAPGFGEGTTNNAAAASCN